MSSEALTPTRQIFLLLTSHSAPCFKHAHFILSCDFLIQARISTKGGSSRGTGPWTCALPRETFWVLTPNGPLSWVPESFRQDIGKISTWKVFIISIIMITQIYNYASIFENCDKSLTVDLCMYSADRPMRSAVG